MKLTYRKVRLAVLIALVIGFAAVIIASRIEDHESLLRQILIWGGLVMYLAAIAIMFVGFKCPACGAPFFKNALFMHQCPVCGLVFSDFELGKKVPLPEEFNPERQDSEEHLNMHREKKK